ncbi:MAG: hypothetical protein ACRD3G_17275 [Vicinamibacterales bacterium]
MIVALVLPRHGEAQPQAGPEVASSFEELQRTLQPGETVYVTDARGAEARGRLVLLSGTELHLNADGERHTFPVLTVATVARAIRDPVRNGVLIGMSAGAGLGIVGTATDFVDDQCRATGRCGLQADVARVLIGAAWGALAGWLIDKHTQGRKVVYRHQPAQPWPMSVSRPSRRLP